MIGMTYPVRLQDADIEASLLFFDFVVPYGKVNIKIEAGNHIVAPVDKSSTHGLFLSCGCILYLISYYCHGLFSIHRTIPNQSVYNTKAGAAFLQPLPVHF